MTRLALAAALLLPSAAIAEGWHGIWSADPAWCANAAQIGSVTPAPIALNAQEMLGYENSCDITEAQELPGLNAWVLTLSCQSEGDTYDEKQLVMTDGDVLWMWWGIDDPVRFARCPA
ncbi:MAG: hypothetical protein P1U83_08550 [Roseovarius sp.]|nr:hypothetical protein [Roseovarius sp.]